MTCRKHQNNSSEFLSECFSSQWNTVLRCRSSSVPIMTVVFEIQLIDSDSCDLKLLSPTVEWISLYQCIMSLLIQSGFMVWWFTDWGAGDSILLLGDFNCLIWTSVLFSCWTKIVQKCTRHPETLRSKSMISFKLWHDPRVAYVFTCTSARGPGWKVWSAPSDERRDF